MARKLLWLAILFVPGVSCFTAQEPVHGTLPIRVQDETGAVFAHATVRARSIAPNGAFQSETEAAGKASLVLPNASAEVKKGDPAPIDVTLKVAPIIDVEVFVEPEIWPEAPTLTATIPEEPLVTFVVLPARTLSHHR